MTLNLLFSEVKDRELRLERIADFVAQQARLAPPEPVDVILLNEVVGGFLSKTFNSSHDLKQLLAQRGFKLFSQFQTRQWASGNPFVGNAILSRCESHSRSP